jgi:sulfotransferase family protein
MMLNRKFRRLLGRRPAGRELAVFPDDTFVVSYPRSGNTWTRFLIANLIGHPTLENISGMIPEIYLYSNRQLMRFPRPRILKSHEPFDPRYKKVIYIVRDPRDVAVSLYHYSRKRRDIPDGYPMDEFVVRYMRGDFFDFCGTWQQHVASWLYTQPDRQLLWLRYEDMLSQPGAALTKIAEFMGVAVTPERIASAIDASSYEHMRTMEQERGQRWKMIKGTRPDIPFIRKAAKGAWKSELSKDSQQRIENAWADTMKGLLYPIEFSDGCDSARREMPADPAHPTTQHGLPLRKIGSPAVA